MSGYTTHTCMCTVYIACVEAIYGIHIYMYTACFPELCIYSAYMYAQLEGSWYLINPGAPEGVEPPAGAAPPWLATRKAFATPHTYFRDLRTLSQLELRHVITF